MSRTELDAATLARSLRNMAGDGSVEWVTGPIQASVLLDVADLLNENAELREVIDDITEVVEVSDPALVRFIAKRMSRMEVGG